jgi:hypothetical protein
MIYFRTSVDGTINRAVFSPRLGTIRGVREIQRQLIYGYSCPFCRNAILFAFLSPEKVSLRKYEESWIVNGSQQIRKIIPSDNADRETAYHLDWTSIPGRTMGIQRVRMKNHILPEEHIGKKDAAHQPGTRCCPYVGVFSARRDLLIKDTILMGGFPSRELSEYNLPEWEQFVQIIRGDGRHFLLEGIGSTPLIMVRSDWVDGQKGLTHWRGILRPFKKAKTAEEDSLETETESEAEPDETGETSEGAAEDDADASSVPALTPELGEPEDNDE